MTSISNPISANFFVFIYGACSWSNAYWSLFNPFTPPDPVWYDPDQDMDYTILDINRIERVPSLWCLTYNREVVVANLLMTRPTFRTWRLYNQSINEKSRDKWNL